MAKGKTKYSNRKIVYQLIIQSKVDFRLKYDDFNLALIKEIFKYSS